MPQGGGIARFVTRQLRQPVVEIGFRLALAIYAGWVVMAVPEAAVHHDDLAAAGENEIWLAGQIGAVQAEAVAELVGQLADDELRFCAFATNSAHVFGARLPRQPVHRSARYDPGSTHPVALGGRPCRHSGHLIALECWNAEIGRECTIHTKRAQ